ncbi:MAG TPA: Uma2 family endonuclease [Rhizomicrobium sp.]|nr:Uma2 family endonuclease [Rhizomicrobium sp.]
MKRSTPPPDPFRFGWRYAWQVGPDGSKQSVQVPLTPEDLLHPKKGDHILENTQQERDRRYLASVLEWRLSGHPQALVLSDCLVNWGVAGLGNHSPDLSVFDGVNDPRRRNWGMFSVAVEGAHPLLVIEVVSPDAHDRQARDNDVVMKVREYYRAGVPLYILVDQERENSPRQLVGYRRGARKYLRMRPDRQGRLLLAPVRLLLGLREERVVCWDGDSGEEIGNLTDMAQARNVAEAALDAEAQARQAAEANRDAEAQAREAAEAALAEAQARIRALEAQLRREANQQ